MSSHVTVFFSFRQSTKGPGPVRGPTCVLNADLAWSFSFYCPFQCLLSAPRPTVARPLETVMPAHTPAWYLDVHQSLRQVNRCVLRVGPGGLESLGLLPTLPHVFLEQSHFSIITRLEAGFEWLGLKAESVRLWIQKRDHWRSRPWSLLHLQGPSLLKSRTGY